jgi:transposase
MAQRSATLPASNEADIQLAISSIDSYQNLSNRSAAAIYRVSERTIRRRRAGKPARRDCQPNSKKLT